MEVEALKRSLFFSLTVISDALVDDVVAFAVGVAVGVETDSLVY